MNKNRFGILAKPAIYKIVNTFNGLLYIGSSLNALKRWNNHLYALRHNKHDSSLLQNAWNKYGEEAFICEVLEYVEKPTKKNMVAKEQHWLDFYQSYERAKGYNACRKADSPIGVERTPEHRKKISDTLKRKYRTGEIQVNFKGHHHTNKTKRISGNKIRLWWGQPENREKMKKIFACPETRKKKLKAVAKARKVQKDLRNKRKQ